MNIHGFTQSSNIMTEKERDYMKHQIWNPEIYFVHFGFLPASIIKSALIKGQILTS